MSVSVPRQGGRVTRAELRSTSRTRRLPVVVRLVTALWAALLLGASILWPMTYGYDEARHIDMAYVYSKHPLTFYGPGELHLTRSNVAAQVRQPGYPPKKALGTAPIGERAVRPTMDGLGGPTLTTGGQPNQMIQHPPLYYWLEAGVLRLPGVSHLAWDIQVWLMRVLSILFVLPLPVLCWAAARRLLVPATGAASDRRGAAQMAVVAAVVPLTLPNLVRDAASVSNDSLLIGATSVFLYGLCRVVTGDLSRRTAVWVAAAMAVALLTKGFALVFPPIALLAYLWAGLRAPRRVRAEDAEAPAAKRSGLRGLLVPVGILVAGGVVGGSWWLRNLLVYRTVQINGLGPAATDALYGPHVPGGTFEQFLPAYLGESIFRVWGGTGLPDDPVASPVIIYGCFSVVVLGLLLAVLAAGRPGDRVRAGLVILPVVVLTLGVAFYGSYGDFLKWGNRIHGAQGRYLYHVILVVAVGAVVGWHRVLRIALPLRLALAVAVLAIVTNVSVWTMMLTTWYASGRSLDESVVWSGFRGLLRWAPLPSALTVLLLVVLPTVAAVLLLVSMVRAVRASGRAAGRASRPPAVLPETVA